MSPVHVFFFRGLSTSGHDHARWAFWDFGLVYKHLDSALTKRQIHFHPVLGLGTGPLTEIAARAVSFLQTHPVWGDQTQPVHFLGHSAGGLIARLALRQLQNEWQTQGRKISNKVASVMTVSSPHHGSRLAQIFLDMPKQRKGSTLIFRSFGYDVARKRAFFDEFTSQGVAKILENHVLETSVRSASIVCSSPRAEWCRALKAFYLVKAIREFDLPSDGVIERDTQPFGDVRAELRLDHFRQFGFFGESHRFEQMCDVLRDHFVSAQS